MASHKPTLIPIKPPLAADMKATPATTSDTVNKDLSDSRFLFMLRLTYCGLRFQYKYPGTPISTIVVPQNASVGRVMIVFSVHAAPINT